MVCRISFDTLGCKLNQYESEALATRFREAGYEVVDPAESAEVRIINTCTVTNRAERKSRSHANRALRSTGAPGDTRITPATDRPPTSLIVIAGCSVSATAAADRATPPSNAQTRVLYVDNDHKAALLEIVESALAGETTSPSAEVTAGTSPPGRFSYTMPQRIFRTRATLKVQDGCNNRCSFCIIPAVRGKAISRPADEVIAEAQSSIAAGAKELVLTGVNVGGYGARSGEFTSLVSRLLDLEGEYRLRISSLEPERIDDGLIDLFSSPRVEHHLHVCLQSANDRVLRSMRRRYTYAEFARVAEALRTVDPLFNLTTDIIVGFPGESEEEFRETIAAIGEIGFGHVHTFPYSPRAGTPAASMPDQIPERERTERAKRVRGAAATATAAYRRSLVGSRETLLVERVVPGSGAEVAVVQARGLGEHYVPLVLRPVDPRAGRGQPPSPAPIAENEFVAVEITDSEGGACTARLVG